MITKYVIIQQHHSDHYVLIHSNLHKHNYPAIITFAVQKKSTNKLLLYWSSIQMTNSQYLIDIEWIVRKGNSRAWTWHVQGAHKNQNLYLLQNRLEKIVKDWLFILFLKSVQTNLIFSHKVHITVYIFYYHLWILTSKGLVYGHLKPISTIVQLLVYNVSQFYWWSKQDQPAVSHWQPSGCIKYTSPWMGIRCKTLVMIVTCMVHQI